MDVWHGGIRRVSAAIYRARVHFRSEVGMGGATILRVFFRGPRSSYSLYTSNRLGKTNLRSDAQNRARKHQAST